MIFVSPAEPKVLREIGETSSLPETYGSDILIPGPEKLVGVQRKQFPGDFISSMSDGRLQTSLLKLTQVNVGILLLEGRPAWSSSGGLLGYSYGQGRSFTKSQLRSLLFSIQSELGIAHHWTDSISDTIDFVQGLEGWAEKDEHNSIYKRPGIQKKEWERRISDRDRAAWILQGIEGMGYVMGTALYDHFGRLPLKWDVSKEELMEVPGIGKGRAQQLVKMIGAKK